MTLPPFHVIAADVIPFTDPDSLTSVEREWITAQYVANQAHRAADAAAATARRAQIEAAAASHAAQTAHDNARVAEEVRAALPTYCTLIDVRRVGADKAIVLARRSHPYHPFVVWSFFFNGAPGVHGGDYCATLEEAIEVYANRR